MRVLLISDTIGLGVMEARPEPAWRVRLTKMRNKDLLAPDYGAMHVAAYLKGLGRPVEIINLVADVHGEVESFIEPNALPDELSCSPISRREAAQASREYLFSRLEDLEPDVILFPISVYNLALYSRSLLAETRKACPDSTIVVGGIYSTLHPEELLMDGDCDVIVRGEGEFTTAELLDAIEYSRKLDGIRGISYRKNSRIFHNQPREPIADLDSLPHPYTVSSEFNVCSRHSILSQTNPEDDYIPGAGFLTSRGCPEACTFCLDPALNKGRTRFHSPGYVKEVLAYCAEHFGSGDDSFFFGDATFTMNKKRLRNILSLIEDLPYRYQIQTRADYLDKDIIRDLAERGFTAVAIGAETFNQDILNRVVKKRLDVEDVLSATREITRAGMKPVLTFIVGLPGESRDSVLRTVEILKDNKLYTSTFFPLVVFRGTELFEMFKSRYGKAEREEFRLNPYSEEYLFVGDEYRSPEELTGFTQEINQMLVQERVAGM